jgi:hypothetical protein
MAGGVTLSKASYVTKPPKSINLSENKKKSIGFNTFFGTTLGKNTSL